MLIKNVCRYVLWSLLYMMQKSPLKMYQLKYGYFRASQKMGILWHQLATAEGFYKPLRLATPVNTGDCTNWLSGKQISFVWLSEGWKVLINACAFLWKHAWFNFACSKMFGSVCKMGIVSLSTWAFSFTKNLGGEECTLMCLLMFSVFLGLFSCIIDMNIKFPCLYVLKAISLIVWPHLQHTLNLWSDWGFLK